MVSSDTQYCSVQLAVLPGEPLSHGLYITILSHEDPSCDLGSELTFQWKLLRM